MSMEDFYPRRMKAKEQIHLENLPTILKPYLSAFQALVTFSSQFLLFLSKLMIIAAWPSDPIIFTSTRSGLVQSILWGLQESPAPWKNKQSQDLYHNC